MSAACRQPAVDDRQKTILPAQPSPQVQVMTPTSQPTAAGAATPVATFHTPTLELLPTPTAGNTALPSVEPDNTAQPSVVATETATVTRQPSPTGTPTMEPPLARPSPTLTASPVDVQASPTPTIGINDFNVEVEDLPSGGKRLTFTWDSYGGTQVTITSGTAERFAPWWLVEASGELIVELSGTIFANPRMTLRVYNDITGQEAFERIQIDWPCTHDYFFAPALERCPYDAPLVTTGAIQQFERGFMIWVPQPEFPYPTIYAFQDTGQVINYQDTWTEAEPESDPALVAPEGFYQPVRGFGKVWREFPNLQEELGWATSPESNYQVTLQFEARESIPGVSYLTLPDGTILQLVHPYWDIFTPE